MFCLLPRENGYGGKDCTCSAPAPSALPCSDKRFITILSSSRCRGRHRAEFRRGSDGQQAKYFIFFPISETAEAAERGSERQLVREHTSVDEAR